MSAPSTSGLAVTLDATAADPRSLAPARALAGEVATRASQLRDALPLLAEPDNAHRAERALRDAMDLIAVAAAAAGLVRTGGGDAR